MSGVIVVGANRPGSVLVVRSASPHSVIAAGQQGPAGPPGANAPGSGGLPIISADTDNRIELGGDGGLFVLDNLTPDPLAYYILSRS